MKYNTQIIFPLAILLTLISCASPVKNGELMKGKELFVQVKGSDQKIEIYPFELDKKTGALVPIPADQVEVVATYSYLSREQNAGKNGRPTRKGEASIPLFIADNSLIGHVKAAGTNG